MKYILQHPIHEMNAWSDPAETHAERDTTHTHNDAESYSNVGSIGSVKPDAEHRLATGAQMKASATSIAGQNGVAEKGKHKLSTIAEEGEKAASTVDHHGGASDDEQHLSDIAESNETETRTKIVRFADFK